MLQTRPHICGECPPWQRRPAEGVVVIREGLRNFFDDFVDRDHSKGTIRFYQRKLRRFYEDLPEDNLSTDL